MTGASSLMDTHLSWMELSIPWTTGCTLWQQWVSHTPLNNDAYLAGRWKNKMCRLENQAGWWHTSRYFSWTLQCKCRLRTFSKKMLWLLKRFYLTYPTQIWLVINEKYGSHYDKIIRRHARNWNEPCCECSNKDFDWRTVLCVCWKGCIG